MYRFIRPWLGTGLFSAPGESYWYSLLNTVRNVLQVQVVQLSLGEKAHDVYYMYVRAKHRRVLPPRSDGGIVNSIYLQLVKNLGHDDSYINVLNIYMLIILTKI